jgi:LmbE family N-acetylglucosaminyl deacetylase
MDRLLVIEAHSDDSAISASGYLEKHRGHYDYHFLVATISDMHMHHCGPVTRRQRLDEYQRYVGHFGGVWHQTDGFPFDADARLDLKPKYEIVAALEKVLQQVQPKVLILQGPSFHHDHTIVYEATIAATRPTARFCPDEILVMENPTYVHSIGPSTDFKPSSYCALSEEELRQKLETFRTCFPSQIREDKNYLSIEGITAWARYRGIECLRTYAEAFQTYILVIG